MNIAYLSLGSNLGDKRKHLQDAITQLSGHAAIIVTRVSPFYKTEPVGFTAQDWFLNAVIEIQTELAPLALLNQCQTIEQRRKRQRTIHWGPRTLDVDILLYANLCMHTPELTLPHPRMLERAFVLIPLHAIAPHLYIGGTPIATHVQAVSDQGVELFCGRMDPDTRIPDTDKPVSTTSTGSSSAIRIKTLDMVWSGADLLMCFKEDAYRSLLDSSMHSEAHGRYTIFCSAPYLVFTSKGKQCSVYREDTWTHHYHASPLQYFESLLAPHSIDNPTELPFIGGAVGYLSYNLCHEIEHLPKRAVDDRDLPDIHFCVYAGTIVVDHYVHKTHIVGSGVAQDAVAFVNKTLNKLNAFKPSTGEPSNDAPRAGNALQANMSKQAYIDKVNAIKNYIAAGDIYQVNLAQRFTTTTHLDPETLYARLTQINPAPYAAFIESQAGTILSSSPECFLKLSGDTILTRPIKGTRPRMQDPEADAAQKRALLNSEKERAELLMIVDLERNDLGRICQPGSVRVKNLFQIESYPTVHHLVGDVYGTLRPNLSIEDILRATFPGGSITGAPKVRAMEVIDELEPHQRSIFTGAIGFIGFDRALHLNIAIRTLLLQGNRVSLQVGAGIVWDSDPVSEYEETLHKAKALFKTLQFETE